MIGIFLAKLKMFIRSPWTFVLFTAMSIIFAFLLGGVNTGNSITIPVYAENENIEKIYGKPLEENETFQFKWVKEETLRKQIENGKAELGVILKKDNFQIIVGVDSVNVAMVERTVTNVYRQKMQREALAKTVDEDSSEILRNWDKVMETPVFSLDHQTFRSEDSVVYDSNYHFLFGFTLFFVVYTIAYTVFPILAEKQDGVWDRLILSPVKKWEMYVGNLLNSFFQGYLQVLIIFFVFRYWIGIDFNGYFYKALIAIVPYVFAIIAFSIFLVSIVKTAQQFNALMPIVAVSMAMIGGAYWPLEIVESDVLLALSKLNPITYGMELLNGIVLYRYSIDELLYPISILILMGVIFMGVGIHLMERRHV